MNQLHAEIVLDILVIESEYPVALPNSHNPTQAMIVYRKSTSMFNVKHEFYICAKMHKINWNPIDKNRIDLACFSRDEFIIWCSVVFSSKPIRKNSCNNRCQFWMHNFSHSIEAIFYFQRIFIDDRRVRKFWSGVFRAKTTQTDMEIAPLWDRHTIAIYISGVERFANSVKKQKQAQIIRARELTHSHVGWGAQWANDCLCAHSSSD